MGWSVESAPTAAATADSPSAANSSGQLLPNTERIVIRTSLVTDQILSRLQALAKRGKLADFGVGGPDGALFHAAAFGATFDYHLLAFSQRGTSGTELRFRLDRERRMPAIAAAVMVFTVFPGVLLSHAALVSWFTWYSLSGWGTAAWYLPLTALPLPLAWHSVARKSRVAAEESAREVVAKIAAALDGQVEISSAWMSR